MLAQARDSAGKLNVARGGSGWSVRHTWRTKRLPGLLKGRRRSRTNHSHDATSECHSRFGLWHATPVGAASRPDACTGQRLENSNHVA